MAKTRPYIVKFQGKDHLVEAISIEQAIYLVVAPHVSCERAATAAEVVAYYKALTSANETAQDQSRANRLPIGEYEQD